MKKHFYLPLFLCLFFQTLVIAQRKNTDYISNCYDDKTCAVVIAYSGLKIRDKPSFESKTLCIVPFATRVLRLENKENRPYIPPITTPDGISGNWELIRHGKIEGYAFNAFLGGDILKIKDKYTLLFEDMASCWSDCFVSLTTPYNYYAVLTNKDSTVSELKKITPGFYTNNDGWNTSIYCAEKRASSFILITKDEISEGPLQVYKIQQEICNMVYDYKETKNKFINQKVAIPESNWVLEAKETVIKGKDLTQVKLFLRDKNTGQKQQLSAPDFDCRDAKVLWCGDFDRDGIMDFMIGMGDGDESYNIHLFLSRDAPTGKLVKPAGVYSFQDCC